MKPIYRATTCHVMGYEALIAVIWEISVIWVSMLWSPLKFNRRFWVKCRLRAQYWKKKSEYQTIRKQAELSLIYFPSLKMAPKLSFDVSPEFQRTAQPYVAEDRSLHVKLISIKILSFHLEISAKFSRVLCGSNCISCLHYRNKNVNKVITT
jgi:hypothetical protein